MVFKAMGVDEITWEKEGRGSRMKPWSPRLEVRHDTGRGKGKLGRSERVAWTYIHYQM